MKLIRSIAFAILTTTVDLRAEIPMVVTDIAPVQSLVASVMGDLGEPALLLDRGADPHAYQLRPSQARAVGKADLIFWVGPEMTPWLDRALKGASGSRAVALLHSPGTTHLAFDAASDSHGADSGEHDHDGIDPHAWLDPANARNWLDNIAAALAQADPEHAARYRANAKHSAEDIAAIDRMLMARLAPLADTPLFVAHDAYGYFAAHFGLMIAGTVAEGDAARPGAAHLADLRARLQTGDVACLFPEAGQDPKQLLLLVEGTRTRIGAPLDPGGRMMEPGPALYGALLTALADGISDCAGAP